MPQQQQQQQISAVFQIFRKPLNVDNERIFYYFATHVDEKVAGSAAAADGNIFINDDDEGDNNTTTKTVSYSLMERAHDRSKHKILFNMQTIKFIVRQESINQSITAAFVYSECACACVCVKCVFFFRAYCLHIKYINPFVCLCLPS